MIVLVYFLKMRFAVLIDTWWNVNSAWVFSEKVAVSFNRYMVECECFNLLSRAIGIGCFNRYMVECE